ncbi:MAG: DUF4430 domain-containing protein [Clostridia bacterium]|nr:DUF4430 domain-containing protein [Clostridia bacterium]
MKKFRILALVLACVMMIGMCVGCSSANDITVTLKFVLNDGSEFVNYEIKINSETPTVELAVNEANATYPDLGATWSDRYELSIAGYPDTQLEDGTFMYWVFTVNGEEATAKANETAIADGDVITYTYTAYVPEEG